jgi:hypothetical protein
MTDARLITVRIERDGRLFVATSAEIKGFLLAHPSQEAVLRDIPGLLRLMLRRQLKEDVIVGRIEGSTEQWVAVPAAVAHLPRPHGPH